jgi:hypothetical protein
VELLAGSAAISAVAPAESASSSAYRGVLFMG